MCGRFVGFRLIEELQTHFPIDVADLEMTPNYNIAPTQEIVAIVRHEGRNRLEKFHWGLVPFWAKDRTIGSRLINARSETAATKPSFRAAFKKRRCLILADGFYEWQGPKGHKQPLFLTLPDGKPFAFAGLWETWNDKGRKADTYRSCTILTREASDCVRPIHHRMPVMLAPEAHGTWLDPDNQNVAALEEVIRKHIFTDLAARPVSKRVNAVKNNHPDNIKAIQVNEQRL